MFESESVLLQRFARTGDSEAFSELVRRYAGLVYGACLRILADKDRAADAVQDTFFQGEFERLQELLKDSPPEIWRVSL